jgi:hypothetical protein
MSDVATILSDIFRIIPPERLADLIGVPREDAADAVQACLQQGDVTDAQKLAVWVEHHLGKLRVVEVLEKLGLSFDRASTTQALIGLWFRYRQIGTKRPSARPIELAHALLEMAQQIESEPTKYDAERLMSTELTCLLRYLVWFYGREILKLKRFGHPHGAGVADFADFATKLDLFDLCTVLDHPNALKASPYNSLCTDTLVLSDPKVHSLLTFIQDVAHHTSACSSGEQPLQYLGSVRDLIECWCDSGNKHAIPKSAVITSIFVDNYTSKAHCIDEFGNSISLLGVSKGLSTESNVLLAYHESDGAWASGLEAIPAGDTWVTPSSVLSRFHANEGGTVTSVAVADSNVPIGDASSDSPFLESRESRPMPLAERSVVPISLFFSYSKKDDRLREKLEAHLCLLRDQGVIRDWHDRRIEAGTEWAGAISEHLEEAGIILLLVSAEFLATQYIRDKEIARAMERHDAGTARVIPVILRPIDAWHTAPFGKLQALPGNGKAVTAWKNRDEAFADVARGIREAVEGLTNRARISPVTSPPVWVATPPPTARSCLLERAALVRTVSELSPSDMARLVVMVEGAASRVSRHGTVAEQAAELVYWAESSTGPGLDVIRDALNVR